MSRWTTPNETIGVVGYSNVVDGYDLLRRLLLNPVVLVELKREMEEGQFRSSKCKVDAVMSDIVISTNGGYPLDQNIYQAVKGMTAAEATVKEGSVIIMLAKSNDGHGGAEFYKTFKEEKDLKRMMATFMATPKDQTRIDQWQSQIFARLLVRATVIYISDAPDEMVSDLHMVPAHSLEEAMKKAEEIVGNPNASVCAIPDGVSVIVI